MNFLTQNFSKSSILLEETDPVSECLNCLQLFTEFENPEADAAKGWVINDAVTEMYGFTKAEQFDEKLQGLWCCDQLKNGEDAVVACIVHGFCAAKCSESLLENIKDDFVEICKEYK